METKNNTTTVENGIEWQSVEPEVWKPVNAGDSIHGVLTARREKGGKYNNETYTIEYKGQNYVVFGTTVLENRMEIINVGDVVKIVYKGIVKNKKNEDMKAFDVLRAKTENGTEEVLGENNSPQSSGEVV